MHDASDAYLRRATIALSQQRYDIAEREARASLGVNPENDRACAILALCLANRKQWNDATLAAERAVAIRPDSGYNHVTAADIAIDRNMLESAREHLQHALRIDPESVHAWALLASLELKSHNPKDALAAAERGLSIDPDDEDCANCRAAALVQLGRKSEAAEGIRENLRNNPQSSITHANMGWTLLHKGDHKSALEHFSESLRLDPGNEWAREGLTEALKSRSPIYRIFLSYLLFMSRLSPRTAVFILIGLWLAFRVVSAIKKSHPHLDVPLTILLALYTCFAVGTVLCIPLSNCMLLTSRFGRHALKREDALPSLLVGGLVLSSLTLMIGWVIFRTPVWIDCAMLVGFLSVPVAITSMSPPSIRTFMRIFSGLLSLACLALIICVVASISIRSGLITGYVFACVLSTWLLNAASVLKPRPLQQTQRS